MSRRNKGTGRGFCSQEAYEDIDAYLFDDADYSYSRGYDEVPEEEEDEQIAKRACRPSPNKYRTAFEAHVLLTCFSHNGKKTRVLQESSFAEDLIDLMDSFED